ncbi:MAG: lysylphosphatidylglycerol synthase transmembrane domain-containing protein [bacterium]
MQHRRSLLLGSLAFVGFAVAGIAFALRGTPPAGLGALGGAAWSALAVLVVAIYGLDAWRYRVLGSAAGVALAWPAALEASVANFFFSWLTPGSALGAPAAIFTLHRRGVPLAAAGLIAFGKSATGTLVLLGLAFAALALGLGPAPTDALVVPLASGAGIVVAALAVPVAASRLPPLRRWLARPRPGWRGRVGAGLHGAAGRLAGLRAGTYSLIFLSHLAYFAAFVGVAVLAVSALGGQPVPRVVGASTVFTAFSYVAPTPGGAGLSEGAAGLFFGGSSGPARRSPPCCSSGASRSTCRSSSAWCTWGSAGGLRVFLGGRG